MSNISKAAIGTVKYQSLNLTNANHLNRIETRSLNKKLDKLYHENLAKYKETLRMLRSINHDSEKLGLSTGHVDSEVFKGSQFEKLLVPIKYDSLSRKKEPQVIIRPIRSETRSTSPDGTESDLSATTEKSEIMGKYPHSNRKQKEDTESDSSVATNQQCEILVNDPHTAKSRLEKIELLKQKDVVFRKRMHQFAIYKNIKKAPVFEDEKNINEMNIPETLKIRDKRKILDILEERRRNMPNPYSGQQRELNLAVEEFCIKQMKNSHLYNGTTMTKSMNNLENLSLSSRSSCSISSNRQSPVKRVILG